MNDDSTQTRGLEPLLTLDQAARYLNVSKASLRRWTNDGRLACHRVGVRGERRFARRDLDAHLAAVRREAATEMAGSASPGRVGTSALDPRSMMRGAIDGGPVAHASLYFADDDELWALVRPYLRHHLDAGLPIVYICDSLPRDEFRARLRADGYPVDRLEADRMVRLLTAPEAYLRTGSFTADGMIAFMESAILDARSIGFETMMLSGEMTWYFTGAPGVDEMIAYEARLNELMARYPGVTTVCSYDLRRFDGAMVVDSLCAHPYAQLADRLVRGFYD